MAPKKAKCMINTRQLLLRSEIPSGMSAKLRTVAATNNRDHPTRSLYYCLFAPHICMVLFFTHIPFVVNHTINATPPERLQHFKTSKCVFERQNVHIFYIKWIKLNPLTNFTKRLFLLKSNLQVQSYSMKQRNKNYQFSCRVFNENLSFCVKKQCLEICQRSETCQNHH